MRVLLEGWLNADEARFGNEKRRSFGRPSPRGPPLAAAAVITGVSLSLYLRLKHNHRASGGGNGGGGGETPYVRCAESSNVFPTEIFTRIKLRING